ncbi:MAG: hypothetical protein HIU89_17635 [Proteobacteria bacterium]|nr:hypothetical protein [Pseudomonadota bacterium]
MLSWFQGLQRGAVAPWLTWFLAAAMYNVSHLLPSVVSDLTSRAGFVLLVMKFMGFIRCSEKPRRSGRGGKEEQPVAAAGAFHTALTKM